MGVRAGKAPSGARSAAVGELVVEGAGGALLQAHKLGVEEESVRAVQFLLDRDAASGAAGGARALLQVVLVRAAHIALGLVLVAGKAVLSAGNQRVGIGVVGHGGDHDRGDAGVQELACSRGAGLHAGLADLVVEVGAGFAADAGVHVGAFGAEGGRAGQVFQVEGGALRAAGEDAGLGGSIERKAVVAGRTDRFGGAGEAVLVAENAVVLRFLVGGRGTADVSCGGAQS